MRIDACFDSHVHWAATGEFAQRLRLDALTSAADVRLLRPEPHHHRVDWLLGFGWSDANWPGPPHRSWLDEWRPGEAIVFTKADGHARWLSTEAMRRSGLLDPNLKLPRGAHVERDDAGQPTGVISDLANEFVDRAMPAASTFSIRRDLLAAARTFNEAGFTHVRDLTCDEAQWNEAVKLDESGLLTLAVEEFFWVREPAALAGVIGLVRGARAGEYENLRPLGIKLFFDGALGSEGALISRCYHGGAHHGLELWTDESLSEALTHAWSANLEVAVHAIGDEAGARVINVATELSKRGIRGALHLEHAQILRPETILQMKALNVRCHLQPAHWLTDHAWLDGKIGDLTHWAFPWRRLQEADVPFNFGSDSPIDPPSVARTFSALSLSADAGVPRLLGRPERQYAYPGPAWTPNTFTLFADDHPREVVFRGEHLI